MSTALPAAALTDEPLARVLAFSRRFGRETTLLAMHAALPLGLTPELVHLLRVNFVRRAPWIAEADLLLSPLCMEAGGGMYEMDPDVRELLLAEMARTPGLGPARQRQVAQFLRLWAARALNDAADPDLQEHLRVQQWVALAYAEPARAAEELAGALRAGVERGSRPEVARVARLTAILSAPLAAEVELRRYAGAVQRVAAGAAAPVSSGAGAIIVGGEALPALDDVVRLWRPASPRGGTASGAAAEPVIQSQSNVADEAIQQQANVADEAIQQGTAEDGASVEVGYHVARVLVLGDERVGKSSLVARIIGEVRDHGHATHGAVSTRWEAWSSETGAQDVVFHEPDLGGGPLAMRMAESDAVLVVVNAGSGEMEGAARRWLSAAAATAVSRPTLLVVNKSDTAEFIPSSLAAVVREFRIGGPYLTSARGGQGIDALQTQLRRIIPWSRVPRAASRDEVDWLQERMEDRLRSSPVADYHEATRHEVIASFLLTAADAEAALGRAMQCLVARDVVRIIGEPPSAIVRSEDYARCLGEVWRSVGEARHDVPGLPAAPLHALEEHFATHGLTEYLDADRTPGVLDLVLDDLARRRWAYEVDTRRGELIVIPALYRPQEGVPGTIQPEGRPLIHAQWFGGVDDIFVLLLMHLADHGTIDLRPPRSALFAVGTDLFQLHASDADGTARITLSALRGGDGSNELVEVIRDRVVGNLPEGVHAEFIYPKSTQPSSTSLDPPAGVDLARACLVVLPSGTKQVGEQIVDFDAVWEHLFRPAIEDVRLMNGEPLVPVRISELPPPGSPLPDWMKAARMVLVDLTGVDAGRVEELGLMPGFRTQHVVLFQEIYDPPRSSADDQVNGYAYGGPEELAGQRALLAQRLAETLGVPGGGTGDGAAAAGREPAQQTADPATTASAGLEPPAGVDLAKACLVVLPSGSRQVGERVIEFDAVWEHLFQPAIGDVRLPAGESLVPVRVSELPPAGSPLPDWMKSAQIVLVDLTGADLARIRELGLIPGFRTQTVVLVGEEGSVQGANFEGHPVYDYVFGNPELLAQQRREVVALLADALGVPGGGTGPGTADTLIITADTLNVRQGPGSSSPVVTNLSKGTRVERLEEAEGWIRIQTADGNVGWISARFAAPESAEPEAPPLGAVRVTASTLNLRAGPGAVHPVIMQLTQGMVLDRLGISADEQWTHVRSRDDFQGWVSARFVEQEDATAPEPVGMVAFVPRTVRPGEVARMGFGVYAHPSRPEVEAFIQEHAEGQDVQWRPEGARLLPGGIVVARLVLPWQPERGLASNFSWQGEWNQSDLQFLVPADLPAGRVEIQVDFTTRQTLETPVVPGPEMTFGVAIVPPDTSSMSAPPARTAYACYAATDWATVTERIATIRSAGVMDIFVDGDSARMEEYLGVRTAEEIRSRDLFLLFWSDASAKSPWVEREWRLALEARAADGKPEIQIHLLEEEAAHLLPEELRHLHADATTRKTPVVFISGTPGDYEERAAVMDACARAEMRGTMKETWPVRGVHAIRASQDAVDRADVYIGIFGHRYGYVPRGFSDISVMEIEFQRAVERRIPIVVFMPSEKFRQRSDDTDTGEDAEKLQAFKDRVQREKPVEYFDSPGDLRMRALRTLLTLRPELGDPPADETERPADAQQARRPRRKGEESA